MENIAKALVAAQQEMTKAHKGSENPHFRSKYADLGNVMDACLPALNKNGIAVVQQMASDNGEDYVVTRFIHVSGESLECSVRLLIGKADMQGMGSAITYARRYGLMSLAGIAPEDDDGNMAGQTPAPKTKPQPKPKQPAPPPDPPVEESPTGDYAGREAEYPLPEKLRPSPEKKTLGDLDESELGKLDKWLASHPEFPELRAAVTNRGLPF